MSARTPEEKLADESASMLLDERPKTYFKHELQKFMVAEGCYPATAVVGVGFYRRLMDGFASRVTVSADAASLSDTMIELFGIPVHVSTRAPPDSVEFTR